MQIEIWDHFEKRVRERSDGYTTEQLKKIFEKGMKEWKNKKPHYIKFMDGDNGTKKMFYLDHKFVFLRKKGGIYELRTYCKRSEIFGQIVRKVKKYEKSFDK